MVGRKKSIKKNNRKNTNRKSAKRNKKMGKKTRVKKRKNRVKVGGNPPTGIPKPDVAAGLYTQEFKGPWGNINVTPTNSEYVNKNLVSANPPPGATTQYPGTIRQGNNYDTYVGVNDYLGTSKNSGAFKIKCTSKAGGKRKKSLKRRKKRIQQGRGGDVNDTTPSPNCPNCALFHVFTKLECGRTGNDNLYKCTCKRCGHVYLYQPNKDEPSKDEWWQIVPERPAPLPNLFSNKN